MAYTKTDWIEYETVVSAFNLNKIEDQLQEVALSTEFNEMSIKSTNAQLKELSKNLQTTTETVESHKNDMENRLAQQSDEINRLQKVNDEQNKEIAYLKSNQEIPVTNTLKVIKSNKDNRGIFTKVTYKRKKDNTVYCISTLSGGNSPLYTTRTERYYDITGTSVVATHTYTLSYDNDGNLVSEV